MQICVLLSEPDDWFYIYGSVATANSTENKCMAYQDFMCLSLTHSTNIYQVLTMWLGTMVDW